MKITFLSFALSLSLSLSTGFRHQDTPLPRLAAVRDAVEHEIKEKRPGWVRKAVTPMQGSTNVIIDQWESGDVAVKITVEIYSSQQEAASSFESGKQHLRVEEDATKARGRPDFRLIKEKITDLGQEGYDWQDAYASTATVFIENDLIVYLSVVRPLHNKDEKLSREFAKHVAKALRSM